MKFYRLCLTFLLILCAAGLRAQNDYITHSALSEESKAMNLGGQAGVLILSPHNDLVITIAQDYPFSVASPVKDASGRYAYLVKVKVLQANRNDVMFYVARKGEASKDEFKVVLKNDYAKAYYVVAVTNPITINQQDGARSTTSTGLVQVEFTTNVTGLSVKTSPKLKSELKRTKSPSGADIITLNVDFFCLKEARQALQKAQEAFDELDAKEGKTEAEWKKLDELEAAVKSREAEFQEMGQVVVSAPNSNALPLNISDVADTEKRSYAVLSMKEKEYVNPVEQSKAEALLAAKERHFNTAAEAYRKALTFAQATHADSIFCRERAERMDTCYKLITLANASLEVVNKMIREKKIVDYGLAEECYVVAWSNYESLYNLTGDEVFRTRVSKIRGAYNKLGLVIEGSTVRQRISQGIVTQTPVGGFSIYAVESATMSEAMERGKHGTFIGKTDAQGKFHVQVERGKYNGLLFVPTDNGDFKENAFVSIKEQRHLRIDVKIYK